MKKIVTLVVVLIATLAFLVGRHTAPGNPEATATGVTPAAVSSTTATTHLATDRESSNSAQQKLGTPVDQLPLGPSTALPYIKETRYEAWHVVRTGDTTREGTLAVIREPGDEFGTLGSQHRIVIPPGTTTKTLFGTKSGDVTIIPVAIPATGTPQVITWAEYERKTRTQRGG